MKRLRATALVAAAIALGAAGAFALWANLGAPGVAPAARALVVRLAAQSPASPAPPASTPTPVAPLARPSDTAVATSAPPSATVIATRTRPPVKTGAIVVRFRGNTAASRQFVAANSGRVIQSSSGWLVASLPTPKGTTPDAYRSELGARSDVLSASVDEIGRAQASGYTLPTDWIFAGPVNDENWWQYAVKAPGAWQRGFASATPLRASASAFKVAVIDTGIYLGHPEMANALTGKDEFQSCDAVTGVYTKDMDITPYDGLYSDAPWHGTAVSGAIGAAVNNTGTVGVGYDVIPVGYKVDGPFMYQGHVYDAGFGTEAIVSAIYDASDAGCRVINMSFGGTGATPQALLDAENYAHSKGVLLVAAAGNNTTSSPSWPADDPNVLSVSAVTTSSAPGGYAAASFSNYGPHIALAAPGQNMVLPFYTAADGYWYLWLDGTSFSSPTVAGAAAYLWRAAPWMSADQITSLLESSAVDLGTPGRDDLYGHGMLDMTAAYNSLVSQYPLLSAPGSVSATSAVGSNSITATWSPVGGTSVVYSVKFDGAPVGSTTSTSLSLDNVARGSHTIAIQPTSAYNWWNSSSAATATVSVTTTQPITPTVTLSTPATKVTYPATAVSITGSTDARSSLATVEWSTDGVNWYPTGVAWTNSVSPAPVSISAPITRTAYLRLAVTAAGFSDGFSDAIHIPYYASMKMPSTATSVHHGKTFTVAETISAPSKVSASSVTFKFYRQAKAGSSTYVLKKSVRATSYSTSGAATTYRARLSLPAGAYRIYAAFTGGGLYASATSAARSVRVK
ncbi:MAG: S8 family serine peptidase [Coriobacteriia bacterium]|nr:S8 family serine peptidase [Coriobacteriia bacterium]